MFANSLIAPADNPLSGQILTPSDMMKFKQLHIIEIGAERDAIPFGLKGKPVQSRRGPATVRSADTIIGSLSEM